MAKSIRMAESISTNDASWASNQIQGAGKPLPRRFIRSLSVCLLTVCCLVGFGDLRAESNIRTIQQPSSLNHLQTRAKIQVDLAGTILVESATQAKGEQSVNQIPLKAKATQDFFESVAFQDGEPLAAARQYIMAKLENWVSGKSSVQQLREDCKSTRILPHDGIWQQYCPSTPLERREVDLLHSPINTLALEKLLPLEPARLQSHWRIGEEDARQVFNLEAVHRSQLKARVLKIEKGVATLELDGTLEGTVDRVPTEIRVRGTAHVELGSQAAFVSWLGVSINEKREISKYRPGFEVTARLELLRKEQPNLKLANRSQLIDLATNDDPARWLIRLESIPARFHTIANRNWITYIDGGEDCVLRLIEDNQSIAQCNISQLPALDAGTQITAEALQSEIRKAMGEHFGEFIESTEKITSSGLRLLRVEVAGTQEEVPIRWIYAHLSDDSGRRLALLFTLAAEYSVRFAGEDLQLLESLAFTARKNSKEPLESQSAARPTAVR